MPTSARGSSRGRSANGGRASTRWTAGRGFTLIELLIVIALVAIGASVVSLALRDSTSAQLEEEAARLAALLESARAESRAAGLTVRWVPAAPVEGGDADGAGFRFVGLPASLALPSRWLGPRTTAQVVGAPTLLLGPDAILPAQRVVLSLDDHRLEIGSDGLGPFTIVAAPATAATP